MKKLLIIAAISLFSGISAKAQDMIFTLNYNFARGTGDFEEFISTNAYRGGGLNFTKFLESNEHIGVGLSIDWHGWYQKKQRESFPYYSSNGQPSSTDINAVQFRYMYSTPIMIGFDYYFLKDEMFLPYVGVNLGGTYTEQELYISAFDNEISTAWDFGAGAEVGFHMAFGESGVGLNMNAKYTVSSYDYTFQTINFETANSSFLSLGLGLSFMMLNY